MLRAGAAAASIAPTDDHLDAGVYLGGYGGFEERGPAETVQDDVGVQALALEATGTMLALASVDSLGIGNRVLRDARRAIARRVDVPPSSVLIGCTHTHSASDLQGLWGGSPESYRAYAVERLTDAIVDAVADLRPATLSAGSTTIPEDLVHNRRGWNETDRTLTVLRAVADDGAPIATLANVAVHPTVVGSHRTITPDFVGAMRDAVTDAGGTALFFNGLQGDVIPVEDEGDDVAAAAAYGRTLAGHVNTALDDARGLGDCLAVTHTDVRFPVGEAFADAWAAGYLEPYAEMRTRDGAPIDVASTVTRCAIGDGPRLEAITVPGEGLTRLGRDGLDAGLRDLVGGDEQLLLGLTHDALGYIVPPGEWKTGRNGDYEESVSLGPETAPRYLAAVESLTEIQRECLGA